LMEWLCTKAPPGSICNFSFKINLLHPIFLK
jgi:hypothetical protein